MKRPNPGTDGFMGRSDACARAEVVEPGLHEEGLIEAPGIDDVAIDSPTDGSIPEPDTAQLMDGVGKFCISLRRDAGLDRDADRTGVDKVVGLGCRVRHLKRAGLSRCARRAKRSVIGDRSLQDVETADGRIADGESAWRYS